MALAVITASPKGTCAIIQTECCVFIPDDSANVSFLLNHMRTQVNTLSGPTPSFEDLINQWYGSWGLMEKVVTDFGIIVLICVSAYIYLCHS